MMAKLRTTSSQGRKAGLAEILERIRRVGEEAEVESIFVNFDRPEHVNAETAWRMTMLFGSITNSGSVLKPIVTPSHSG